MFRRWPRDLLLDRTLQFDGKVLQCTSEKVIRAVYFGVSLPRRNKRSFQRKLIMCKFAREKIGASRHSGGRSPLDVDHALSTPAC